MSSKHVERREWLTVYSLCLAIPTTTLLGLRFYSRFKGTSGGFGVDDIFILIGWALGIALMGIAMQGVFEYQFDRHLWDIEPHLWGPISKTGWLIFVLFLWSTAFIKISVLLFYRRLVRGTYSKHYKWLLWGGIMFIVLHTVISFMLLCFTCIPTEAWWRLWEPDYKTRYVCMAWEKQSSISKASGAMSVVSDFYSVLLPALLLTQVRIARRRQIGLYFVFGIGIVVVVAGIVRTIYVARTADNVDKTWYTFTVVVACLAEIHLGVMAACAPSIKALFTKYFHDTSPIWPKRSLGSSEQYLEAATFGSQPPGTYASIDMKPSKQIYERT